MASCASFRLINYIFTVLHVRHKKSWILSSVLQSDAKTERLLIKASHSKGLTLSSSSGLVMYSQLAMSLIVPTRQKNHNLHFKISLDG